MLPTKLAQARTHNLAGIDLTLEAGTLVAIAGPSGAGKSSLAFATLYAEGQRRYVESFSAYARQFLERLPRPDIGSLEPVPAAAAVDRKAPVRTSRSTVGTMTEIADYVKALWARTAVLHCDGCGRPVGRDTATAAAATTLAQFDGRRVVVTYPVAVASAEAYLGVREGLLAAGYRRLLVDNEVRDLDRLSPANVGDRADVVADRMVARSSESSRLVEALAAALARGHGRAEVHAAVDKEGDAQRLPFSTELHCPHCDRHFSDPSPGLFSFNSPIGACETCRGFGRTIEIDYGRVIPDRRRSLADGAVRAWEGKSAKWEREQLRLHARRAGVRLDVPVSELNAAEQKFLFDGEGKGWKRGFFGLVPWFAWLEGRTYKMHVRVFLSRYRKYEPCKSCAGTRLRPEALRYRLEGMTLPEFYAEPLSAAHRRVERWAQEHAGDAATRLLLDECAMRLGVLESVGLGYLSLDRSSRTLSGGEAQRVALSSALCASLSGAMIVLDEPTVGLHPQDVDRLFEVIRDLSSGDNLTVVVEHDPRVLGRADRIIELGPGAGDAGGRIVFDGTPAQLRRAKTATARAFARQETVATAPALGPDWLVLSGASGHNLRDVTLRLPLGALSCVTGVSGSGKSTLVLDTLCGAVERHFGAADPPPLPFTALEGQDCLGGVVRVDQTPLGRTSRGNPATYTKAWDVVRKRFAAEPLAKARDYDASTFSFNVAGGRCEACKGEGAETIEMQFLADVTFSCAECGGRRFGADVLDVRIGDRSVADVLEMTVEAVIEDLLPAADRARQRLAARLEPLVQVGLGYLRLGQPLNTLSGGEAQRLKLARALVEAPASALVVLDEPTAGLHHGDVVKLLGAARELIGRGCTVVIVDHDMQVAAQADWIVDMGPGAGPDGGTVVAMGPPQEVMFAPDSRTAPFLAHAAGRGPDPRPPVARSRRSVPAAASAAIEVRGAREHNLKSVSLDVPRERLVVVTGRSGSGKSTLAFDVIYAEGQRRFLETLSPYARQYLPHLPRPAVDSVRGVPPSVSLEQRMARAGAGSTVATLTEVAQYLRLLYATTGEQRCPACDLAVDARSIADIATLVIARCERPARGRRRKGAAVSVFAPIVRAKKGAHRDLLARARREGFAVAEIDGSLVPLTPAPRLDRYKEHDVALLVASLAGDDLTVAPADGAATPLTEALRRATTLGNGAVRVVWDAGDGALFSTRRACPSCGCGYPELDPRFFSFNTRQGACPVCEGRGEIDLEASEEKPRGRKGGGRTAKAGRRSKRAAANAADQRAICSGCSGTRLSPLARSVRVAGLGIHEVLAMAIDDGAAHCSSLALEGRQRAIAAPILSELERRFGFLRELGLGYLGLGRGAATLSGGEVQRVKLAAQLGSGLTGVLYVLDEPTIGLHPRDTGLLIDALKSLVARGNTALVVEHDMDTIRAADHIIDVGPGGGRLGGQIVYAGEASGLPEDEDPAGHDVGGATATGAADRGQDVAAQPSWLRLRGARQHNLAGVNLAIPLGRLTAVTGVSGSGKSTLVRTVLLPAVRRELGLVAALPGLHDRLDGLSGLARAVEIDQSPIGRTPRSVPATYVGIWDEVRKLLAGTPTARVRGYSAARFSFNVAGGRCESCAGQGASTVEMSFLPEVLVACEACRGARFLPETLAVELFGLNAGQLLELEVGDAVKVFAGVPKVRGPLALLADLGLGYLKIGQASNTLSGGEAQRLKLVAELSSQGGGATLFVMDEPTTGLHRADVQKLLGLLHRLVDRGHTVVVVEHHPDVMLAADWIVDLGPEAGAAGGRIVSEGTPRDVAARRDTHTARVLWAELARQRQQRRRKRAGSATAAP